MALRVATARSVCSVALDKRVRELVEPAISEWLSGKIDEVEVPSSRLFAAPALLPSTHIYCTYLNLAPRPSHHPVRGRLPHGSKLSRRKGAAVAKASEENAPLSRLDKAFAARTAALSALATAEAAAEEAEKELEDALQAIEAEKQDANGAGPSGVKS